MSEILGRIINQPPEYALAYMRARGFVPSPSFDWRDVWQECHTTAFTVAKSAGYDILGDIQAGLEKALAEGRTFRQFAEELTPLLQAKGWWGRADAVDPLTGLIQDVQLGSPRRLRIIYDTNMRTAHAAGTWVRVQEQKATHPYLRYVVILDGRERYEHRLWHGVTLPADHPFWKTHYPPNGWRCRCAVMQLSPDDMDMFGYSVTDAPQVNMVAWENARTGEVMLVPEGIDPGFAYNVGQAALEEHSVRALMGGLDRLPPRIAAEAMAESARFVLPAVQRDLEHWLEDTAGRVRAGYTRTIGERRVLGALTNAQLDFLQAGPGLPASGTISMSDKDIVHMQRLAKPHKLEPSELALVPQALASPRAILWNKQKKAFVYVYEADDSPAILVVQPSGKAKFRRMMLDVNSLRTGKKATWEELRHQGMYTLIQGKLE